MTAPAAAMRARSDRLDEEIRRELAAARRLLDDANYQQDPVRTVLGGAAPESVLPEDAPVYRGRIDGPAELTALVRLFVFGESLEARALKRSLGKHWRQLIRAGLVSEDGGAVRPQVRLVPYDGLLIASDPGPDSHDDVERVLGVEPSSITLANLTVRRSLTTALDLGTGSGLQALLASRHASSVLAVETSSRCLRFAELNAALNGITSVSFAQGSWYEPVADRAFDLVVANPPFALAPTTESVFEHASEPWSDATSRQLVEGAGVHLNEGGLAQILCSWVVEDPDRWAEPVVRWLGGTGCDAILLRHGLEEAASYAVARHGHLREADGEAFASAVDAWREGFAARDIRWIAWGALALRRRSGVRNWIAAFDDVALPGSAGGEALEAMFVGADFMERQAGPQALLDQRLIATADLRRVQLAAPVRADPRELRYELDLPDGAGVHVRADHATLATLIRLGTAPSLRQAIPEGILEGDAEAIASTFRELLVAGLVRPR